MLFFLAGCCAMPVSPQSLQRELAAEPSATAVLQRHCDRLTGGRTPLRAQRLPNDHEPALPDLLANLAVPDRNALAVRHVSLHCGNVVFSEAWNWYVTARLTPEMNRILASTDQPFGRVVRPLGFHRHSVASTLTGLPRGIILQNRALLLRHDDAPIAFVLENYFPAVLDSMLPED